MYLVAATPNHFYCIKVTKKYKGFKVMDRRYIIACLIYHAVKGVTRNFREKCRRVIIDSDYSGSFRDSIEAGLRKLLPRRIKVQWGYAAHDQAVGEADFWTAICELKDIFDRANPDIHQEMRRIMKR